MLVLSSQESLEIMTRLAVVYAASEYFKERRGYTNSDHLEEDRDVWLSPEG